jgi:hypothetical protein
LQIISLAILPPPPPSSSSSMPLSPPDLSSIPYCSYNQSFHYSTELLTAISCSAPFSLLVLVSVVTPSETLFGVSVVFRGLTPVLGTNMCFGLLRRIVVIMHAFCFL